MDKRVYSDTYKPGRHKIAVLGLGHVGLPTALGLAELGWEVTGADEDRHKVSLISSGKVPFYEPGVSDLLSKHLASGRFKATHNVLDAVRSASIIFLCVGTPQKEDGAADLSQVESIAQLIGRNLDGYKLIVEKSTVPAVTAQWVKRSITMYASYADSSRRTNGNGSSHTHETAHPSPPIEFDVASNPEFMQEGRAVEDFFRPTRIVLGVDSEKARQLLIQIYQPLQANVLVCDLTTAELIKYAANAFLAMKISYINMVAEVCDAVGADVSMVARGLGLDKRIGPEFLSAGLGFGGYCFPKDLRGFIHLIEQHGLDAALPKSVEQINLRQPENCVKKLVKALWVLEGKTIGILGLAFKPGTDDLREAPSIKIIESLLRQGASVRLYDPMAMPQAQSAIKEVPGRVTYCSSPYQAAEGAQAVLLVTEWNEFRQLDWNRLYQLMDVPILVDGRNCLDPETVRAAGFEYLGVGRGTLRPRHGAAVEGRHFPTAAAPAGRLPLRPAAENSLSQELR